MLHNHSYKAKIEDNILTWTEGMPPELRGHGKHDILVTVPTEDSISEKGNGAELAAILEKIASTGLITDEWIKEWEEANRDRPLYGREK